MKSIRSGDNPFFKELVKLAGSSRERGKSAQTLLDGPHLLNAYLDAGMLPRHILLNTPAPYDREIAGLLERMQDIPATQLDDKLFARVSELKSPTGILALIEIPPRDLAPAQCSFALLLEDIQDPGNLGSMLRSAAAAGCDAAFLSPGCADAWSPKVLRAAMGGHFALRIHERQELPSVARAFDGTLFATCLQAGHNLFDSDLRGNVAFLVGNEGAGLSDQLLNMAIRKVTIPMRGRVESLNVAAATAICLFEAVRQRHGG